LVDWSVCTDTEVFLWPRMYVVDPDKYVGSPADTPVFGCPWRLDRRSTTPSRNWLRPSKTSPTMG